MIDSLQRLGLAVGWQASGSTIDVPGCGGAVPVDRADLFVGNSGTTVRFLAAMLAATHGTFRLDGVPRMRERPIQDLLDALAQLGVHAISERGTGCPPVRIDARGLEGGTVGIRGDVSSQFLSGLLMAAPYARRPVEIQVLGQLVSQPYVAMTLRVMESFGIAVAHEGDRIRVPVGAPYQGIDYEIEPDASAASYFWAAAAITQGRVLVTGLGRNAMQGDVAFCDCLAKMGCEIIESEKGTTVVGHPLRGIDVDMNAISDTVQTLGAVALFAEGPTRITGVGHIRHKETDRIGDLARELRKLGAQVDESNDGLEITPGPLRAANIDTYDDHRMAMSLALPGLRIPGIQIRDPGCTAKTYPHYFRDLRRLCEPGTNA
jgi:3-phosphoshikimate 1-carboxyvinyltransferase